MDITFQLSGVTVPDEAVYGISYNTSHNGYQPFGQSTACYASSGGCGYDSLNIALSQDPTNVTVGSDPNPGTVWQYSDKGPRTATAERPEPASSGSTHRRPHLAGVSTLPTRIRPITSRPCSSRPVYGTASPLFDVTTAGATGMSSPLVHARFLGDFEFAVWS